MKLRTELKLPASDWRISHKDGIVLLGSCFASQMGARLQKRHFPALVNPFGITYHPIPLLNTLQLLLQLPEEPQAAATLEGSPFYQNESWGSFHFHSEMNRKTKEEFMENVHEVATSFKNALEKARYLILTLGTAIAHNHNQLHIPVANCHRFPQAQFQQQITPTTTLQDHLKNHLQLLQSRFPKLRILTTVSPIRHIRSGIVENGASKATLRAACHHLTQTLPNLRYFPSYEIMLDDLRDYRFYEADLIHPNALATDYIWQRFGEAYFDEHTQTTNREIEQLHQDLGHRSRNPESNAHQEFIRKIGEQITALEKRFDMSWEKEMLKQM